MPLTFIHAPEPTEAGCKNNRVIVGLRVGHYLARPYVPSGIMYLTGRNKEAYGTGTVKMQLHFVELATFSCA